MNSTTIAAKVSKLTLVQLWFSGFGFLPVLTIVLHCAGLISMQNSIIVLIVPAIIISFHTMHYTNMLKPVLQGWISGIAAVFLYDISRIPFIFYGWEDFIPKIGAWITMDENPSFIIGYMWRYIGNGGGMGISFFMFLQIFSLRKKLLLHGISFGLFVFSCLIITLLVFDEAQQMMFTISPLSFVGSFVGHVIYGAVLGFMAKRFTSPPFGHLS
ncbi:MAG: hypothetical protein ACXWW0_07685 [Bacteroidia bacterium]